MIKKKGIYKHIAFTMMIFWVVLFASSGCILYTLNLADSTSKLLFLLLIPVTLIVTILIYLISNKYTKKQLSAVTKLIEEYGPGEKCAEEIKLVIAKEKNAIMKMQYSFILANIYISEMAEPEKALEVLNSIDKFKLFRKANLGYQSMQCKLYYLLFVSYGCMENDDAIINIFNEGSELFNKFFNNNDQILIWNCIIFGVEKAKGNYDKALEIMRTFQENEDSKIKTAANIDIANIYIKMGRLNEAEELLNGFDSRQHNVAVNKEFDKISARLNAAKASN